MRTDPFALLWTTDVGHEVLGRAPVLLGERVVLPLATGLAWVDVATGRIEHVEGDGAPKAGRRRSKARAPHVVGVAPLSDAVVAAWQDGSEVVIEAFDADAKRRWRTRLPLGVAADCIHAAADRVLVVGSDETGLHGAFLDADGKEVARWPLPTADVRIHRGVVLGALPVPVDGRAGVMVLNDTRPPRWLVDAPAFRLGLHGALSVLDTWDGWQATSELVCFSLDEPRVHFRCTGGPNVQLLPVSDRLAHLEHAPGGPVVVLRALPDGTVLWRSAPVGADVPGLFGRCTGAVTLLDDDVIVWLHGGGLVRLARSDGALRGEQSLRSLLPAGVTPTTHGLLLRYDREVSLWTLS